MSLRKPMESSRPIEFWLILQIVLDVGLILLFLYFVRRLSREKVPAGISNPEDLIGIVEPVLSEARAVAEAFEDQLKEKQKIIKKLNTQLDNRIISMNL